jgi:hypothetical protein
MSLPNKSNEQNTRLITYQEDEYQINVILNKDQLGRIRNPVISKLNQILFC